MIFSYFAHGVTHVKKYNMYKSLDAAAKFDGSLHDAPFSEHSFISLSIKYVIEVKMSFMFLTQFHFHN